MKSKASFIIILLASLITSCEKDKTVTDIVTFDELITGSSGYWNGSDLSGGFTSGNAYFTNHYDTEHNSWSGFSYSSVTDTLIKDYTNQYSSIAKGGLGGSGKYCVCYSFGEADTLFFTVPEKITEFSLTNTVYTYHTIKKGNQFSKKFGGVTGNDKDWFKVRISGLDVNGFVVGWGDIYLADYRFDDKSLDVTIDSWETYDLSGLGYVKALKFELSSSDTGPLGMNTPAYFCIDNIKGELASE